MMTYNYHTHTYRCGHATGTPEEYVQKALQGGIKDMGFSDHFKYLFTDGKDEIKRAGVEANMAGYIADIRELKERYRDSIAISVGFEMEYYEEFFEEMFQKAVSYGAEYLILGQHFVKSPFNAMHTKEETQDEERLKQYVSDVVHAIQTGVFSYVAHPDVLNFIGDAELFAAEMRSICVAAREYDTPLEINFLGIREKRNYPNELFWKIAGEEKAPVTFGFDVHQTECAYDGVSLAKAEALVEKYGLNYIGKPVLRLLSK